MRPTLAALALAGSLLASSPGHLPFVEQLWTSLSALWNGSTAEEGCGWDPSGRCRPDQDTLDAGCGMDPSGRCGETSQAAPDAGCGMDPDGCPKGS